MSLDLYSVVKGIEIESADLQLNSNILIGNGLPGGDAAVEDAAPIGSVYFRTDVETDGLQLYWKSSTANNSAADWKQSTDKEYVDAVASGLSWREPVVVNEKVLTTLPVGSAGNAITVDGVSIVDNDRVLFSNLTTAPDVYIYDQTTGTFSIDPFNTATSGDAVLVNQGTYAAQQWVYNGTAWVVFGSAQGAVELGDIRAFIGKTGPGAELPSYTSVDVVTSGDNLEVAIGKIDAAIGNGDLTNTGGNFAVSSDGTWATVPGTNDLTLLLNDINEAIGDRTYTQNNVILDGETVAASLEKIDVAVGQLQDTNLELKATNVTATTAVTIDSIATAVASEVKWLIQVRETGTPANRRAVEVHALTDGTVVDYNRSSALKLGAAIAGLGISVDINASAMRLRITATNNIDYVVKRITYSTF